MFEDKNNIESDLIMRSILDGAQEEVPASAWDEISARLDKASEKKVVALPWRRAAIGFGVAAALAAALMLNHSDSEDIVPAAFDSDMIAVIEAPVAEEPEMPDLPLVAQVIRTEVKTPYETRTEVKEEQETIIEETIEEVTEKEILSMEEASDKTPEAQTKSNLTYQYNEEYMPSEWEEEPEKERRGLKTSLVLYGMAGTNGDQTRPGTGLIKQPSISTAPLKTGVKKTSTKSIYGIPVSFGAGIKIDFTQKWGLGVGINYTLLTQKFYGSYTKVNEQGQLDGPIQSGDIRNSQHYLGIPVNLFYNIVNTRYIDFYAYAGGAVEKCLKNHYQLLNKDINHIEDVKGVQLSANLGVGVEFLIGKHLGLYADPSLNYYFDNGQPSSIRTTAQPFMLGFEMGLRVKL